MSGVRVSHLRPKCVDERCNTENTAQKRGVFTYLSVFRCKKLENEIFQRHDLRARAVRVGAEH